MTIFTLLVIKLVPLYLFIALGFVAGRWLDVRKESIARLLIYLIAPVVIFSSVMSVDMRVSWLILPVLFCATACMIALAAFRTSRSFCESPSRNILAFSTGSGNSGYFGFPVVIATMGESFVGVAAMMALGLILFENTLGFYLTARGRYTTSESLRKVAALPTLYAFILAITLNLVGLRMPAGAKDFVISFRGAYTVLGMMMIGLGAAQIRKLSLSWRFVSVSFIGKFLIWPAVILTIVWMDHRWLGIFNANIHRIMILMSAVPLPANSVAVATELNADPEQTSTTVLASTVFALGFIPAVMGWVG